MMSAVNCPTWTSPEWLVVVSGTLGALNARLNVYRNVRGTVDPLYNHACLDAKLLCLIPDLNARADTETFGAGNGSCLSCRQAIAAQHHLVHIGRCGR